MKRIILIVLATVLVALGGVAAVAADPGNGNGPPALVPGSPGDDCSHGNSDKSCRPDPQPEHGKDCEDHGNARGNEDHCGPAEEPPPPTTTPEVTTSTPSTPTSPSPQQPSQSTSTVKPAPTPGPAPLKTPPTRLAPRPQPVKSPPTRVAKVTVVKVQKKAHGVVVVTTADGRKHVGVMGSG